MRWTHCVHLYREGDTPDGSGGRRGSVEDFGDPEVRDVDARVAMAAASDTEEAAVGRRASPEATITLKATDIPGFTIRPGDGVKIVGGDWTEPRHWHVVSVLQPGASHWDVVLEAEANDAGF